MSFIVPFPGASRVTIDFLSAGGAFDSATSHTFNTTFGGISADRVIVVFCCVQQTAGTITCTIGGVSATQVLNADSSTRRYRTFTAAVPTGESGDIVIATAGSPSNYAYAAYSVYGTPSATPHDSGVDVALALAVSIDIPANGAAMAFATTAASSTASWTNLNEDFDDVVSDAGGHVNVTCASDSFETVQTGLSAEVIFTSNLAPGLMAVSFGP